MSVWVWGSLEVLAVVDALWLVVALAIRRVEHRAGWDWPLELLDDLLGR